MVGAGGASGPHSGFNSFQSVNFSGTVRASGSYLAPRDLPFISAKLPSALFLAPPKFDDCFLGIACSDSFHAYYVRSRPALRKFNLPPPLETTPFRIIRSTPDVHPSSTPAAMISWKALLATTLLASAAFAAPTEKTPPKVGTISNVFHAQTNSEGTLVRSGM